MLSEEIPGGGSRVASLSGGSDANPFGDIVSFTAVYLLLLIAAWDNPGAVRMEPDATDGFDFMIGGVGAYLEAYGEGGVLLIEPAGIPVSAASRRLLLTNTSSSQSASFTLIVVGAR